MYTIFCDSACDLNDEFLKKYEMYSIIKIVK